MYMSDKLIISDIDNYSTLFESTDTRTYSNRYTSLNNEYMLNVTENMVVQDDNHLLFLIMRGIETITHCFKFLLMYTKNIELTVYHCKKAIYYYVEFIGQISDISIHHACIQLNSKDATLFVYKKTIFDINNTHKKKYVITENEHAFLDSISNIITLFNSILYNLLQIERLKHTNKKRVIHFVTIKSSSIIDNLFNKNNYFLTDIKTELCLFVFDSFKSPDINITKYSNICEIFIKKIRKFSDKELPHIKLRIKEKLYNTTSERRKEMSALRYINWILHPL